jgi:very-short-patch-repair endonuclease
MDVCACDSGKRPSQIEGDRVLDVCLSQSGKRPDLRDRGVDVDVCVRGSWPDVKVGETANHQHGLITRRQLFDLGLTRGLIDNAVARRRLVPVHRGVYAVGHLSLPQFAPYMAAVLAVGEAALLSHRSAAHVWGITAPREGDVDVTVVARDAGRRRPGIHVRGVADLDRHDATEWRSISITSPARTLLDITPALSPRDLERAFDGALKNRILTRHGAAETVARSPRLPGAARLAALARAELATSADTRSDTEERFLRMIRAGRLPEPEMNARLGPYTVDALWRQHRLVVELDSYGYHGTRWSFESDHERDLALSSAGFVVMRFTRDQIVDHPELVLVRLAQRLSAAEAQLGRSSRIVS